MLTAALLIVTVSQTALTIAAPFGAAALGGTNPGQLPEAIRFVTAFPAVMWLFASLIVLARAGPLRAVT